MGDIRPTYVNIDYGVTCEMTRTAVWVACVV